MPNDNERIMDRPFRPAKGEIVERQLFKATKGKIVDRMAGMSTNGTKGKIVDRQLVPSTLGPIVDRPLIVTQSDPEKRLKALSRVIKPPPEHVPVIKDRQLNFGRRKPTGNSPGPK